MIPTKNIPDKASSGLSIIRQRMKKHLPSGGFFFLATVLVLLSGLACFDFSPRERLFISGEIATSDVVADRSFLFEDSSATRAKREQAKSLQPLVLDLVTKPAEELKDGVRALFVALNQAEDVAEKESLRQRISEGLGEDISLASIAVLSTPEAQAAVTETLLPVIDKQLRAGVLPEMRTVMPYKGGVIIRDLTTGEERLHPDPNYLPDLKSLELLVSQEIKKLELSNQAKKTLNQFFEKALRASLVPNYETTASRAQAAESAIQPVIHRVQRGELLVRQGELVRSVDQLKMQSLFKQKSKKFNVNMFLGVALSALLLSTGLLFAPSSKPVTRMDNRDYVFLALLVLSFALAAKGFSLLALRLAESSPTFATGSLAYAVPVAGAAGLSSMIFATRRYVVTGLLISFFCTIMSGGGVGLFLFYFLACMCSTWLTSRTASRQDVVKTVMPLMVGLYAMWCASTFFEGGPHTRYFPEAVSIVAHAFMSMLLTFALAPVIEMVFGYTTRFRLMELLNLEQPLLRELMLSAPGTYHHSLIVSNMVETGAKAIGAHSLLCKVAALYHDIGKISKAQYFIENQSPEENPHDKLSPSMSALILISHVKQGTELALQHKLGREVTDIIRQHHGSSVIQYFYQKALQQTDVAPPKIEDFSYPGPKPQSREAALVMLADIVEASSRTLDDPTPKRLRQHADTMIKNIYATGQLDETELTFRDLNKVADSFSNVLRGIFHHRISYPGSDKQEKNLPKTPKATERSLPLPGTGFQPRPADFPAVQAHALDEGQVGPYAYSTRSAGTLMPLDKAKEKKDEFPSTLLSNIPQ